MKMKNKPEDVFVGSICESNQYGKFEIVEIRNMKDIDIVFVATGYKSTTTAAVIRKGQVMDRLMPNIFGVGFIGDGKHTSRYKGVHNPAHSTWVNIIGRCYDPYTINKNLCYSDCFVCDEWHNFQSFADWYNKNHPNDGKEYCIEKDIKNIGNKIYSPENCMFVTRDVNGFVLDSGASRGKYLIGASWLERLGKFQANCNNPFTRKMDYLGIFSSELDAHMKWRSEKYNHAIKLANQQEREEVKAALIDWAQALKEFRIHPIDS